ncbi:MAG: hypothetical protein MUE44_11710 [Oscillatoriaceae cyanobacterium Prado104]|nr:hypothetical protein [Oscillatoriaceae cyanobacterium Prado104]
MRYFKWAIAPDGKREESLGISLVWQHKNQQVGCPRKSDRYDSIIGSA